MQIDKETLYKMARLARLEINPAEEDQLLRDMSSMLSFVEKLKEVNTEGVEPLTSMTQEVNRMREDQIQTGITREEALRDAPQQDGTFFRVPKVIE